MARARLLKIGFFKNEELSTLSFEARLCFQGLWLLCDREGRLEDRPKRIKAELFPYDTLDIFTTLNALTKSGFIVRYAVDAVSYISIPTFTKHQFPHSNEPVSVIPPYHIRTESLAANPESLAANPESLAASPDDAATVLVLVPALVPALVRTLVPDQDPCSDPVQVHTEHSASFARFWSVYPKRVGKGAALKAWKRINPQNGLAETICAAVQKHTSCAQWQKDGGQFIPHPATWLNQTRWEDDVDELTQSAVSEQGRKNLAARERMLKRLQEKA